MVNQRFPCHDSTGFLAPTDQSHRLREVLKGRAGKYEKGKTPQEREEVLVQRHGTLPWRVFPGKLKLTYYLQPHHNGYGLGIMNTEVVHSVHICVHKFIFTYEAVLRMMASIC